MIDATSCMSQLLKLTQRNGEGFAYPRPMIVIKKNK